MSEAACRGNRRGRHNNNSLALGFDYGRFQREAEANRKIRLRFCFILLAQQILFRSMFRLPLPFPLIERCSLHFLKSVVR